MSKSTAANSNPEWAARRGRSRPGPPRAPDRARRRGSQPTALAASGFELNGSGPGSRRAAPAGSAALTVHAPQRAAS
jgi:hypothetical protein